MARIRKVELRNFRAVQSLDWCPSSAVNCLIGPGDSGKSTIIEAIDYCLGARRNMAIVDTDFHGLDVTKRISIAVTLSDLPDTMLSIETFGEYLRAFDGAAGVVEDEPRKGLETVLTVLFTARADLEPVWSLYSERTVSVDPRRGLPWKDRATIAPSRLGNYANSNLSWMSSSVLNRLSDERADINAELVLAARDARVGFGAKAAPQLATTLMMVTATAKSLGVSVGGGLTQLLTEQNARSERPWFVR